MPERPAASISDYLAAERTFLAWIRTGLALMGFGFVVARFGLFLQALELGQSNYRPRAFGPSFWLGTALIVLGVVVNLACTWRHVRLVRELNRGGPLVHRASTLAVTVALVLAVLGLGMAFYLVSVHDPHASRSEEGKRESMMPNPENGIVTIPAHHSVDETVEKVKNTLAAKGVKVFAVIDHSGEAEKAGMQMPNTKLLIFGSPKAGTPLMLAVPGIAIDLPMKLLIAEDAAGHVSISYNSPAYLQARHHLPPELAQAMSAAGIDILAAKAAE